MLNERYDGSVIDENKSGLARELARMNLTLNSYTQDLLENRFVKSNEFLFLRADNIYIYNLRSI